MAGGPDRRARPARASERRALADPRTASWAHPQKRSRALFRHLEPPPLRSPGAGAPSIFRRSPALASGQRLEPLVHVPVDSCEAHEGGGGAVTLRERDHLAVQRLRFAVFAQGKEHLERAKDRERSDGFELRTSRAQPIESHRMALVVELLAMEDSDAGVERR